MKTKILTILMVGFTTLAVSCGKNISQNNSNSSNVCPSDNQTPRLKGYKDFKFDKEDLLIAVKNNFYGSVTAFDNEDGDLTNKITYKVINYYTKEEVTIIDKSVDGKYVITYTVTDSCGASDSETCFIMVGDPNNNLTSSGEPKEDIIDYNYEEVAKTYETVFETNFDYEGLPGSVEGQGDYGAYSYQVGAGGWGNNEVQYYASKDPLSCYVSNGALKISVYKKNGTYYSTRLNTNNNVSANWTYGKYEVVAKVPSAQGSWPAIWMMPNNSSYGTWPASGEIDIMETSQYYKNYVLGTIHVKNFNGSNGLQKGGRSKIDSSIYTDYHTYAVEWLPDILKFSFDGEVYFQYIPKNYAVTVDYTTWPFDKPFHFIFNIAMGGNMGGTIADDIFDNDKEVAMYIDSIKVSQSTYLKERM